MITNKSDTYFPTYKKMVGSCILLISIPACGGPPYQTDDPEPVEDGGPRIIYCV